MARVAYLLVNVDLGSEKEVLGEVRKQPMVKEAYEIYGVYDIVAKVEADDMDKLKESARKIRHINHIRSTLTLVAME